MAFGTFNPKLGTKRCSMIEEDGFCRCLMTVFQAHFARVGARNSYTEERRHSRGNVRLLVLPGRGCNRAQEQGVRLKINSRKSLIGYKSTVQEATITWLLSRVFKSIFASGTLVADKDELKNRRNEQCCVFESLIVVHHLIKTAWRAGLAHTLRPL